MCALTDACCDSDVHHHWCVSCVWHAGRWHSSHDFGSESGLRCASHEFWSGRSADNRWVTGSDISRVLIGLLPAAIVSQTGNQVVISTPSGISAGPVDVIVSSASRGSAVARNAFTYSSSTAMSVVGSSATVCALQFPCIMTVRGGSSTLGTVTATAVSTKDSTTVRLLFPGLGLSSY
jgi:hypothetical protein